MYTRRGSSLNASICSTVPSVELSSTTITLKGNDVFCASAEAMACPIVRTLFLQGITTDASYSKSPWLRSTGVNSGASHAPTSFRCSVQAASISICTSRLRGST